jgi:flagellar basal-body rod protein FlgC
MDLDRALGVSAAGMAAQSTRLRVIAENVANSQTTGQTPGADPYRRKTVTFGQHMDRATGVQTVAVSRIGTDQGEFETRYDPGHPAADERGYVKTPNVNTFIEITDMQEAQGSYSANLSVLETTRGMLLRTIEALKG